MNFSTKVYVYDSMNKDDKVLGYTGSKSLSTDVLHGRDADKQKIAMASLKSIPKMAEKAGSLAANTFTSTWTQDSFMVIYYDGADLKGDYKRLTKQVSYDDLMRDDTVSNQR